MPWKLEAIFVESTQVLPLLDSWVFAILQWRLSIYIYIYIYIMAILWPKVAAARGSHTLQHTTSHLFCLSVCDETQHSQPAATTRKQLAASFSSCQFYCFSGNFIPTAYLVRRIHNQPTNCPWPLSVPRRKPPTRQVPSPSATLEIGSMKETSSITQYSANWKLLWTRLAANQSAPTFPTTYYSTSNTKTAVEKQTVATEKPSHLRASPSAP